MKIFGHQQPIFAKFSYEKFMRIFLCQNQYLKFNIFGQGNSAHAHVSKFWAGSDEKWMSSLQKTAIFQNFFEIFGPQNPILTFYHLWWDHSAHACKIWTVLVKKWTGSLQKSGIFLKKTFGHQNPFLKINVSGQSHSANACKIWAGSNDK